jgi:hypothetical protein
MKLFLSLFIITALLQNLAHASIRTQYIKLRLVEDDLTCANTTSEYYAPNDNTCSCYKTDSLGNCGVKCLGHVSNDVAYISCYRDDAGCLYAADLLYNLNGTLATCNVAYLPNNRTMSYELELVSVLHLSTILKIIVPCTIALVVLAVAARILRRWQVKKAYRRLAVNDGELGELREEEEGNGGRTENLMDESDDKL